MLAFKEQTQRQEVMIKDMKVSCLPPPSFRFSDLF